MTQTETHLLNGRYLDTQVIKNATDKPLELHMHHFDSVLLLVNEKTGDILFHFFARGDQNPIIQDRNLVEQVFLAQDGDKTAILLNTNHNNHKPPRDYIEKLQGGGKASRAQRICKPNA